MCSCARIRRARDRLGVVVVLSECRGRCARRPGRAQTRRCCALGVEGGPDVRCGSVKRVTTGVLQAMLVCSCYYHMGPDSSVDGDLWQRKVSRLLDTRYLGSLSKRRGGGWQSRGEVGAHGDPVYSVAKTRSGEPRNQRWLSDQLKNYQMLSER